MWTPPKAIILTRWQLVTFFRTQLIPFNLQQSSIVIREWSLLAEWHADVNLKLKPHCRWQQLLDFCSGDYTEITDPRTLGSPFRVNGSSHGILESCIIIVLNHHIQNMNMNRMTKKGKEKKKKRDENWNKLHFCLHYSLANVCKYRYVDHIKLLMVFKRRCVSRSCISSHWKKRWQDMSCLLNGDLAP